MASKQERDIRRYFNRFKERSDRQEEVFLLIAKIFPIIKKYGEKKIARLKNIAPKGSDALNNALSGFRWVEDALGGLFDYVRPNWITVIIRIGDCDENGWLCDELMPGGTIIGVLQLKSDLLKSKAHCMFVSKDGDVWSNFRYKGNFGTNLRSLAKSHNRHWTHIVIFNTDKTIKSIIKR